ncbi:sulfatase [Labilibacter sediminis]|nr:sulfatase [Labilibacter sediminis]
MKKTNILTLLITLLIATSSVYSQQKPNVVMIVLDDLNDYLGVMDGHPQTKTPHMDKLANEGVLFDNAHSNAPVCAPSRASFMKGILPSTSQNYGFTPFYKNNILANSKSLSVYAAENGYKTYQTGKIFHHRHKEEWQHMGVKKSQEPLAYNGKKVVGHPSVPESYRNIGPLDGTFASLADIPSVPASKNSPGYTGWWHQEKKKKFRYVSDDDRDLLTDEKSVNWFKNTISTLESNKNTDEPFFIGIGLMNPHTPLVVPQKYFDKFPLESVKIPVIKEDDNADCKYDEVLSGSKGRTHFTALKNSYSTLDEGLRRYLQAYLACVSFADDMVGGIMNIINNSIYKDNTIVILFSDHGYNMGEKDYLFKNSLWEESTRVPLIIKDPRYAHNAGKTVKHPVSLVDIYPTVSELCGLQGTTLISNQGASLDGYSLKPFLENVNTEKWEGPDVALTVVLNQASKKPEDQNYSVRSRDYRYVRYSNGSEELYDHRNDSHEWVNEADNPRYAQVKKEMRDALEEQIKRVNKNN